ncbi:MULTISPECIES: enoyl-CoA hydratase/isomerase family protein [Peribacillus]|uniref:enoyl-CoA hydratase/isomerase family protein n=1 Tax=Peribacillus TaxID=2675229 RepID=UPI0019113A8D|nr:MULTISPECIES: enoyl-CoA hydratase-related protein [unclassified Peribacillus]MBK5446390.1 enoyl-CoA hydratase/isomerase family protein [Peribacillus sp. TH24]MBK5458900.1 enoyl-CoA hydratase/isomerase family protein [Peribacillus sp. TH27]MBK5502305.1 enoyl-CoA hydratase/isomerase family protein [Peribacillus sp. TH14]WMX57775.1 enoyl-CoA hydratase-related protein [Peribacillus sp. R9-11]
MKWIKPNIENQICTITINNPPMNILTKEFREEFVPYMENLKSRTDVRVIILTGDGDRAFCAGADLNEEGELTPETVRYFLEEDCRIYDVVNEMPQPVIAAVNGYAFGGGFELILACDIRIMSDRAKLCAAGVKVGLVVGPTRLVRLMGEAYAKEVILTGRTVLANEAFQRGLASKVVPHNTLMNEALDWAKMIASRAPIAVRNAKETIQKTMDVNWQEAMAFELDAFITCQDTQDHKHAIESFFNKQIPIFQGR